MSDQPVQSVNEFPIVVKGPNREKVDINVTSSDTAASLRERIIAFYSLSVYSNFHFEVDTKPTRTRLDEVTSFGEVAAIKSNAIINLVCDQYTTTAAREHIKRTVALVTDTLPLIMLMTKKQVEDVPESVLAYENMLKTSMEGKEPTEDMKPKESYLDKEAIEKDQQFKGEIEKPKFPIQFNLDSFTQTLSLLSEKKEYPLCSIQMSAYNPPSSNRQLIGDLAYLRVVTKENAVFHITCCTNGFYVSQSSDSVFDASASEDHSTVYSTLCHLLVAVSPAFEAWYKQHVEEGDRTEKFSLEEILDSLPTLASNTIPSQHWFASSQDNTLSVELLQHASQLIAGEALPYLSSDVSPAPNWLQEYNLVKDQVDAELQPFYSYSLENEFAAAAVRGARRIVDEALIAEHTTSGLKTYQVDGITFSHIEPSLVNTGARALANYSVLGVTSINTANVSGVRTILMAVVDYCGRRFLAQTPVPGVIERPLDDLMLSGSYDSCKTLYKDERVQPQLAELAKKLHWATSQLNVEPTQPRKTTRGEFDAPAVSQPIEVKENEPVEFVGPADGKLLRGLDGNVYGIDFLRCQPVDACWLQEVLKRNDQQDTQYLLRPELVQQLVEQREQSELQLQQIQELLAKLEKGEKVEGLTEERAATLRSQIPELETIVKNLPMTFDPNALTPFSYTTVSMGKGKETDTTLENNVLMLSNFLKSQVLPVLHTQLREMALNNQDSSKLAQLMHSSGVNLRYLGELASLCVKDSLEAVDTEDMHILRSCELEMVARAAKQILTVLLADETLAAAPGYVVAAFLNALLASKRDSGICLKGVQENRKAKSSSKVPEAIAVKLAVKAVTPAGVWDQIWKLVDSKFLYKLRLWGKDPKSDFKPAECERVKLLRRVCSLMGICVSSRAYDLNAVCVLAPEDVLSFVPRVKCGFNSLLNNELVQNLQQSAAYLQQGFLSEAFFQSRQLVLNTATLCQKLHPVAIRALNLMASILFMLKDFVNAVKYNRMALKYTERAYGVDSIEAAICHSQLSEALGRAGARNESILHAKACLDIYVMACGDDSEEIGEVYANLGLLYEECVSNQKALDCLAIAQSKLGKKHPLYMQCLKGLAQCSALMMKWSDALKYEKMYQDVVKESELEEKEKETLVKESEERIKMNNQKSMLQKSMRSILG